MKKNDENKQQRGTGVPPVFPWTRQREGKDGTADFQVSLRG